MTSIFDYISVRFIAVSIVFAGICIVLHLWNKSTYEYEREKKRNLLIGTIVTALFGIFFGILGLGIIGGQPISEKYYYDNDEERKTVLKGCKPLLLYSPIESRRCINAKAAQKTKDDERISGLTFEPSMRP